MDYKIDDICSTLSIGKSTIYKRLDILKENISVNQHRNNEYFYYTENNRLFITEKGFDFIKTFKPKKKTNTPLSPHYEEIVSLYKSRIEYLENENKRLLDIIALKEHKEIAKDVQLLDGSVSGSNSSSSSFFTRFLSRFKHI